MCVVSVQIRFKHISTKGDVMTFFGRKECVGAPEQLLGFVTVLNMWDLVGCLELDSIHPRGEHWAKIVKQRAIKKQGPIYSL
jgi:hypothetical protein